MSRRFLPLLCALVIGLAIALPLSSQAAVELYNPLGSGGYDIREVLGRVIKGIISIIGSLALLMFVYGGTLWLTSGGNSEMVKKGKDILVWSTLGLVVIFTSYAIVSAVLNALTSGSVTGT